ncbi:MAG TPA: hypothetical protein GXX28_01780, partial [Firmicutes bacterium]|nr:hypothetical protein [Bacillota bacterium]
VLNQARKLAGADWGARRALDDLAEVWDLLESFGVTGRLAIDLGLVKDLAYYTGLVLEGYVPRLGYTLCSGGRYDGLYARFGAAEPATGFALGLERVTEALARESAAKPMGKSGGKDEAAPPAPGAPDWPAWARQRLASQAGEER